MKDSSPTIRQRILKVLSYPVPGSIFISLLLMILGLVPWYWINRYIDKFFQIETKTSYYSLVADRAVQFEKKVLNQFRLADVLINNLASGKFAGAPDLNQYLADEIHTTWKNDPAEVQVRWIQSTGDVISFPGTWQLPIPDNSTSISPDIQLVEDGSGRWWFYRQSHIPGHPAAASITMAVAVDSMWVDEQIDQRTGFFTTLFTKEGLAIAGDPVPLTSNSLIDTIYLDGLRLSYGVEPEVGWVQFTRGKNILFWVLGFFLIAGTVIVTYLILRNRERLHQSIAQRTKDLEQEFRQRLSVEEDLDKSQAAFMDASRRAHIGIWECDVMTDEIYWSDELYRIIDETPYSFVPTINSFQDLIHPDDVHIYTNLRHKAIYDHVSGEFEFRVVKPKGGIIYCWVTVNPKLNARGELITLWGIAQDITILKAAERQLKESNRILQMVNLCDQLIVRETVEQTLLEKVSSTMTELGGYPCILLASVSGAEDQDPEIVFSHSTQPEFLDEPSVTLNKYTLPVIQSSIRSNNQVIWCREDQKTASGRKAPLRNLPYSSMAVFPVQLSETAQGALVVYDMRSSFSGEDEVAYLRQLADDLSIGIQSIRRKDSYARALDALRLSENKFSKAFHTSPDSIAITRLSDGTYIDINEGFISNSGYSREEIIGKKLDDINVWANLADREYIVNELRRSGVLSNYEADFIAKDGHSATGLFSARLIEIEGEVYLLSITRDISDRIDAARALRESEERYRLITESMAETIWLMDLNFVTTYVSPSVERNRGFTFEEIRKMPMQAQLTPESYQTVMAIVQKELTPERLAQKDLKITASMEVQFYKKDGSVEWSEVTANVLRDGQGNPTGILCVGRNITERKKMQEALHLSEERWQYALEGSGEGVWDWDLRTNQIFFSRRWKEMIGYSDEEIENRYEEWEKRLHPDDSAKSIQAIRDHLEGKSPDYSIEFRMKCKDGSYKWILDRGKIIERDADGNPIRFVGTHTDMTVSRTMQLALEESEKSFRLLAERSNDMITRIQQDGRILYTSPASQTMLGYPPGELVDRIVLELIYPEDRSIVNFVLDQAKTNDDIYPIQFRMIRQDEAFVWVEASTAIIRDPESSDIHEIQITIRDITERVAAETALRQSEEKLRSLITQSTDGIMLTDEEGRVIEWSKGQELITGMSAAEALGKNTWDIEYLLLPREDRTEEGFLQIKERTIDLLTHGSMSGHAIFLERTIEQADGRQLVIQSTYFPIETPSGFMTGMISRDITSIKLVEKALKESEERLRFVTDNMLDMVTQVDAEWNIRYASPSIKSTLGFTPEELMGTPIFEKIHPDDHPQVIEQIFRSVHRLKSRVQVEYRYKNLYGVYLWMESLVNLIYDKSGKLSGAIFGTRDISDRRSTGDALRESESRYRTLAHNFPNGAVMLFDTDLRYTVADGAGLAALGLDRKLLEGHTIHEIFTPETISVLEPYYRAVLKGRTEVFELELGVKTVQFYAVPIRDEQGEITTGMVMTQDVTDRKQALQALSDRAQYLGYLNEITRFGLESEDLQPFVQHVVDLMVTMFESDSCCITAWDDETRTTIPLAGSGPLREIYPTMIPEPGQQTLTQAVLDSSTPMIVEDMQSSEFIHPDIANKFPVRSVLILPLLGGGRKLGAVLIGFNSHHDFKDEDIFKADQVAGQVALGMYKHRLLGEIQTANQELERRVADRTADLEAKNKELETFTYSVSHDLKAPLRGIEGYSRLLVEDHADQLDQEGIGFLQTIRTATNQMNQLIEDLLSYSRLERRALTSDQVDLRFIVDHLIKEREDEIKNRSVQITNEVPSVFVNLDQRAFDQALRNLLDNALKFTRQQEYPEIHFSLSTTDESYILSISDNGIGFDMKYKDRIFDIFQRLHLPDDYPGTGIGLALVKKAMQRIGGRVWATSNIGLGSTFYLEIPKGG